MEGLFEGLDLHVEPRQVQAVVGSQNSVSAVLLAIGGRLPLDHGRMSREDCCYPSGLPECVG